MIDFEGFIKTAFGILLMRRVDKDGAMADLSAAPVVVEVPFGKDTLKVTIEYIKGQVN